MMRLWIDRGPQISHPQVHLSRAWSKAQKQLDDRVVPVEEKEHKEYESFSDMLPVCTTGFAELINVVLELFGNPKNGRPDLCNIGTGSQPGMVDFVTALVEMVDLLIDYHLIAKDRSRADADYETIRRIYHALHRMTDVQNNKQAEELAGKAVSKKRIASLDKLRKTALSCMWRLMNMRGNHRSVCARAWPCCNLIIVIVVFVVVVVDHDIDLVSDVGLAAIVHVLAAQTMIMTHGSGSQGPCL